MQSDYTQTIDRIIHKYEGGYGWNKKDPGGPTNWGITCYDLAQHRGQKMTGMAAWADRVRAMTLQEAEDIYATKYAAGLHYGDLPLGIDSCMLDYGINSGITRPIRVARAIVGLGVGGVDGPLIDKLHTVEPTDFIAKMCQERLRFMHAIKNGAAWAEFGHGWGARVADIVTYSDSIARGVATVQAPDLGPVVMPKATNVGQTAPKTTAGGAAGTAATLSASGYHWPYIVGGVAAVLVAGIAYEVLSQHKANAANNAVHL